MKGIMSEERRNHCQKLAAQSNSVGRIITNKQRENTKIRGRKGKAGKREDVRVLRL